MEVSFEPKKKEVARTFSYHCDHGGSDEGPRVRTRPSPRSADPRDGAIVNVRRAEQSVVHEISQRDELDGGAVDVLTALSPLTTVSKKMGFARCRLSLILNRLAGAHTNGVISSTGLI